MAGLTTYDAAEYLRLPNDAALYLEAALEESDPVLLRVALGDVARAFGVAEIAERAGLGRDVLHRMIVGDAPPDTATVVRIIEALAERRAETNATHAA